MSQAPVFADILEARKMIGPCLQPTPLISHPALNSLLDAEVYVKRDYCLPPSAFEVRSDTDLEAKLTPDERAAGIICSSPATTASRWPTHAGCSACASWSACRQTPIQSYALGRKG